ncbi:MAG TPA: hypothetical protein VFG10_19975 [Saprospiraceae bacterium]|nr:hypothetical protein [Saprospiraceae bacterium]
MRIFDIFRKRKLHQPAKSNETFNRITIFYHEDDFCQIEILPGDNFINLKVESQIIRTLAKENFDGTGFTDIHVRDDKSRTNLNQLQIKPEDVDNIFKLLGTDRISNVITGYGQTYRIPHENCIAFGKDYNAIYYDFKDNIVQHIWLTNPKNINRTELIECLYELGNNWNLLLQDWNRTISVDLRNKQEINNYLQS